MTSDVRIPLMSQTCFPFEEGGYLYLFDLPNYANVNKLLQLGVKQYSFQDMMRQGKGVFTFVIIHSKNSHGENQLDFVAMKTYSPLELYSKHQTILDFYNYRKNTNFTEENIFLAGEIKVRNKNYFRYNFLSGTYMVSKMKPLSKNQIVREFGLPFESFLRDTYNYSGRMLFDLEPETYIPDKMTWKELEEFWEPLGVQVFYFEKKNTCLQLGNSLKCQRNEMRVQTRLEQLKQTAKLLCKKNPEREEEEFERLVEQDVLYQKYHEAYMDCKVKEEKFRRGTITEEELGGVRLL